MTATAPPIDACSPVSADNSFNTTKQVSILATMNSTARSHTNQNARPHPEPKIIRLFCCHDYFSLNNFHENMLKASHGQ